MLSTPQKSDLQRRIEALNRNGGAEQFLIDLKAILLELLEQQPTDDGDED